MQCVILAAGEGIRMRPLTLKKPKQLVRVAGKPLIDHIVSALPEEIDELIFVIGYLGKQIQNYCSNTFHGRRATYIWQEEKRGTADALIKARKSLKDKFLLMYADDLHEKEGLMRCLRHELCLLIAEHDHPEKFGVVVLRGDGTVETVVEKPENPPSHLVSTGVLILDERIFTYSADRHPSGEYFLTSMVAKMMLEHPVYYEKEDFWFPISTPEDIQNAEIFLLQ